MANPSSSDPAADDQSRGELNRRALFAAGGHVAVAGGALVAAAPAASSAPASEAEDVEEQEHERAVTVRQGTNISAAMSPDGQWVAIDLCTALWVLPARGGRAHRITGDLQDASRPRFSPDGSELVFQSYLDGNFHVWVVDRDGSDPRQLTGGPHDHREPCISPDGRRIAFSSDRGGGYGIWLLDRHTSEIAPLADSEQDEAEPSWSPDGRRVVFTVDEKAVDEVGSDGARRRVVEPAEGTQVFAPSISPDGVLAYARTHGPDADLVVGGAAVTRGEDVFPFGAQWLDDRRVLYTADGAIRLREPEGGRCWDVPFTAELEYRPHRDRPPARDHDAAGPHPVRGIAGPVASPDGTQVAFRALGALWVLPAGGRARKVVEDGFFNSDPDWFPDGRSLVYSSDRGGTPALWRHDLESGQRTRLTQLPGAQVTPRCSPDGAFVAYQDEDGATWVLDLRGGTTRQVLPALFQPGRPSWSRDGRTLALAAVKPFSKRFREGTSQVLTVDLVNGATQYTEPAPFASLSTRGDDGPVFSPDGRHLAFVVESQLHVVEVDERGAFRGRPRRLTEEVTDAPSWCGSDALLYLNNGRLRKVPLRGGGPSTVEVGLTWARSRPRGRLVLRAGALWDGESDGLRRDVDITIEGDRVVDVGVRDEQRDDPVVDAAGLTVMPGLIDAHNHWHMRGRFWGARQGRLWLSYGITAVRSPADPAYQMLETREGIESGAVLGPRYLATGEAIDGSRIYYNCMRPTRDAEGLRRELERASELDYDLVKTYVRLPTWAQLVAARSADRPLTSHYLYPAVHLGVDGMEHTGSTNRLGYSQTVSKLGRAYEDAVQLFAKSGMSITPTLFNAKALFADDRSLVEDRRTRVLYPEWEYRRLLDKAEAAGATTPSAERTRRALASNVDMVLRIHRAGGFLIAGTDSPLDDVAVSLHQNLRAMVRHGFAPHEALLTATRNPARWLGFPLRLGPVRPGRWADLVAVRGDPLRDVRAAADVRKVVAGGAVHEVDELLEPFAGRARGMEPANSGREPVNRTSEPAASADPGRFWWHGEPEWSLRLCC